jgi:pimeloyl-ACP methyl ester carboxylesterase
MPRSQTALALTLTLLLGGLFTANVARSEVTTATSPAPPRLYSDSRLIVRDRISVEVIGQGPDLILIPGLASSRETWRATADRLKSHYRLHLIEVAGFAGEPARGNSEGPVLIPTAEAIDAYIRDQGLSPATVIGHSLGGTMILWLAVHHPEDLRKALVVDALPSFAIVMMGPNVTAEQVRPMAEAIRHAPPTPPSANTRMIANLVSEGPNRAMVEAWYASSNSAVVANALADDLELDLRPDLAAIHTPILLLYPDNTPAGAPAGAMDGAYKAMFAGAPGVRLSGVDHSLHFIMLDQPTAFAARLDAFLATP